MTIENIGKLTSDIAEGLKREVKRTEGRVKVGTLEVVFVTPHGSYEFGLVEALEALGQDIYWDERGNWSDATEARVATL